MAKLIHIVGSSGSGKTTVHSRINQHLHQNDYEVIELIEPGPLREIALQYRIREDKDALIEAAIFSSDRFVTYHRHVFPRIDENNLIFSFARGLPDTYVYQGFLGGVDLDLIRKMNIYIPHSDIYIVLIVDGKVGHQRIVERHEQGGDTPSRNEMPDRINMISGYYRRLEDYFRNYHVLDTTSMTREEVFDECIKKIERTLRKL